jgi:NitT/TauT family transport system permease protein
VTAPLPPISVAGRRRVIAIWDVIAVLLVLGTVVFLADASREILRPLPEPGASGISLDPLGSRLN